MSIAIEARLTVSPRPGPRRRQRTTSGPTDRGGGGEGTRASLSRGEVASDGRGETRTAIVRYTTEWQAPGRLSASAYRKALADAELITFPRFEEWRQVINCRGLCLTANPSACSDLDEDVRKQLEGSILPAVEGRVETLGMFLRFLRHNTGASFVVTRAVDDELRPAKRVVETTLSHSSAMDALSRACAQLNLTFVIEDGIVRITTKRDARSRETVEFYEVHDLAECRVPRPEINLLPSTLIPGVGGFDEEQEDDASIAEGAGLIQLIRTTVDPTSWREDPDNTISMKSGTLVVRQTGENHRAILLVLSDLRRMRGPRPWVDIVAGEAEQVTGSVDSPSGRKGDSATRGRGGPPTVAPQRGADSAPESLEPQPVAVDPYRGSASWKREQALGQYHEIRASWRRVLFAASAGRREFEVRNNMGDAANLASVGHEGPSSFGLYDLTHSYPQWTCDGGSEGWRWVPPRDGDGLRVPHGPDDRLGLRGGLWTASIRRAVEYRDYYGQLFARLSPCGP